MRIDLDLAAFEFLSQLLNRQPLEPLMAVPRVVASASPVHPQKPSETVHAQFTMENTQGVLLKLLIRHLFQRITAASPAPSLPDSVPESFGPKLVRASAEDERSSSRLSFPASGENTPLR